ncbi:hypothetical protein M6D93_01355 [Jatrophihabitans telluris]|uniref:Uncharacterized protein n=1 Tax=Jatrophihabitans telluris TaxID=2038343 RepID=A0ABY4QYB3_9ACTN|nr:hypothetical protein [Jatrophihabitans telluris]UQX88661.1 hypothetical protein M6D93_01355 [Jatrophihabitans telluris]
MQRRTGYRVGSEAVDMANTGIRGRASHASTAAPRAVHAWRWLLAPGLLAFLVWLWGGYVLSWKWTGLSGSVKLWDWLQVLALPVALGLAPLLIDRRRHLRRVHHLSAAGGLIVFAGLVLAGYLVPLGWTGFTGNTLWDWLELLLLPLVVATGSLWVRLERQRASTEPGRPRPPLTRRRLLVLVVVAVLVVALVLGGYLIPLSWTGFRGNTAWDWVKLMVLPLLIPLVILPVLARRLDRHLTSAGSSADQ